MSRGAAAGLVIDDIVVDIVAIHLAVHLAVPAETFVGGGEHHVAPTVNHRDLESVVVDLVQQSFWNAEVVVDAVAVGREGVRENDLALARVDGDLRLHRALALGGRHAIGALVKHGDGLRGFACAPKVVLQRGHHLQHRTALIAEAGGVVDDVDGRVDKAQVEGIHLLAAVLVQMGEGVSARFTVDVTVPFVGSAGKVGDGAPDDGW